MVAQAPEVDAGSSLMVHSISDGVLGRFQPPNEEAKELCVAINATKASSAVSDLLRARVHGCRHLMEYVDMMEDLDHDVPLFDGASDRLLLVRARHVLVMPSRVRGVHAPRRARVALTRTRNHQPHRMCYSTWLGV